MPIIGIIFWGLFIFFMICYIFTSVSGGVSGALRRENRRQRKYYRENMDD